VIDIYIPSGRFLEGEVAEAKVGLEGWFTLRAIRRSGRVTRERKFKVGEVRELPRFHNLITNLGLDRFGSVAGSNLYSSCHVGTGTAPPSYTDTQLQNYLATVGSSPSSSAGFGNSGPPDYYAYQTFTWTSAIGALGNNNLTEIGVGGTNPTGTLFSRELIRDSNGNPAAFPISSDEQLQVTYELRLYPNLADVPATVTVGSSSYDTITRPLAVNNGNAWRVQDVSSSLANAERSSASGWNRAYTGDLVPYTSIEPSDNLGDASSGGTASYTNGSYYRDIYNTWNISTGNGNIRTVVFLFGCAAFQVRFDPVITKSNTQVLTLHQRMSWARR
jgi:hypothetical protein